MTDEADYLALFVTLSVELILYATFDNDNSSMFITRTVIEVLSSFMFNMAL